MSASAKRLHRHTDRAVVSKVTQEGRVTIPKAIREELGLHSGDEVFFERTDEGYVLRRSDGPFERWHRAVETDQSVETRMEALRGRR